MSIIRLANRTSLFAARVHNVRVSMPFSSAIKHVYRNVCAVHFFWVAQHGRHWFLYSLDRAEQFRHWFIVSHVRFNRELEAVSFSFELERALNLNQNRIANIVREIVSLNSEQ